MDLPPPDYRLLRFRSDDQPENRGLENWRMMLSRKLIKAEFSPLPGHPFVIDASLRVLSGFRYGFGTFGPSIIRRTGELAATEHQDYYLIVNLEGPLVATVGGDEVQLGDGEGLLLPCINRATFERPETGRLLCARFERAFILSRIPDVKNHAGRVIGRKSEALRLFTSYLTNLDDDQSLATPELRTLVVTHIYELFALALSTSLEASASQPEQSGLFRAIARSIAGNITKRDLTIAKVASENKISVRRLQRLFEAEGVTFSQFLSLQRLQRVHDALVDVRQAHLSVSSIALSNGFGDISHFNKVFRLHFGKAPSDVRQTITGAKSQSRKDEN